MANTENNILLALSCRNYIACSTQPKSGLLASCQGQRVYLGKPFNLHKHAWERSSPWENSQHQSTNLKVCGWSFASARHRSTLPRAKVVCTLSVSLASENRFWGRWGKAGYWNGPELSRTISKLGTISSVTGTISFFGKIARTISFVLKNRRSFSLFPKTTPELSFPTALQFLCSLPCPHMAWWAKMGDVTVKGCVRRDGHPKP